MRRWRKVILMIVVATVLVVALAVLVSLSCISCGDERGFTLIIKGLTRGTQVFINNVDEPIGIADDNGEIILRYLRSDIPHQIRLKNEGYEASLTEVRGREGEVIEVMAPSS